MLSELSDERFAEVVRPLWKADLDRTDTFKAPDSGPVPVQCIPCPDRYTRLAEVIVAVAKVSEISTALIEGDCREHRVSDWRAMVVYIGRKYLGLTFAKMARLLKRDHSTVAQVDKKFIGLLEHHPVWTQRLNAVLREL